MKILNILTINLILALICSSCNQKDKLIGKWERYGDEFHGLQIEIKQENESFKAEIIYTPDTVKMNGFYVGDIKWKSIKKIADDKYEYEDLKKTPSRIFNNELLFTGEYKLAQLQILSDTLLKTRVFAKGDELIGSETSWRKVD